MNSYSSLMIVLSAALCLSVPVFPAQFPLKLPKISVEKPRPQEPKSAEKPTVRGDQRPTAAEGSEGPTIAKDSVQIRAFTFSAYRRNNAIWSWVPEMRYTVNGPIASGSRLLAEFTIPGTGPWLQFDCAVQPVGAGFSSKTECGGRQIAEDKSST